LTNDSSITVSSAAVTASNTILITVETANGQPKAAIAARSAGVNFTATFDAPVTGFLNWTILG
jgi:hypothetical protein